MMKLEGKIALITGGGRGIGRAIALAFAREGASIAVAARTSQQVEVVATEVRTEFGVEAAPFVVDVSDAAAVQRLFSEVGEKFGRSPDILVNNAGIAESAALHKTDDELWLRHIAVNLSGTFYFMRAAVPAMCKGAGAALSILLLLPERPVRHTLPPIRLRSMACWA